MLQAEVARRVPSLQEEVKRSSSRQDLDLSQCRHAIRDRYSSLVSMQCAPSLKQPPCLSCHPPLLPCHCSFIMLPYVGGHGEGGSPSDLMEQHTVLQES